MRLITRRDRARRGATTVETALVLLIAFLFMFGIFEYGRFMFFLEVAENAAREGARFATVYAGRGITVGSNTDVANIQTVGTKKVMYDDSTTPTVPAVPPTVRGVVNYYMRGRQGDVTSYNIEVNSFNPQTGANGAWDAGGFGTSVAVRITGNYQFMAPQLLGFTGTVPINIRSMTNSEAN